ncbi:DHHC palmitoyltransferase-domain-containing protein [Blastocladiella britannica]|nr:DHHC palmitoyltransferase-domain-containing protein [Blastocladiella britannica]
MDYRSSSSATLFPTGATRTVANAFNSARERVADALRMADVPRRRSNFAPPLDPYFFLYLLCVSLALAGLLSLLLPAVPPPEWIVPPPPSSSPHLSLLDTNSATSSSAVTSAASATAAAVMRVHFASAPVLVPRGESATLVELIQPVLTGYYAAVNPFLRPALLYVLTPILAICVALTVVVGHLDLEDPRARSAPVAAKVPILQVYGPLMEYSDHWCRVDQCHVGSRTRHCRRCNLCVEDFDHHCQFLNCCIGKSNYRLFFTLISLGTTGLVLATSIAFHLATLYFSHPTFATHLATFPRVGSSPEFANQNGTIAIALFGGFLGIGAVLTGYLTVFHVRLRFASMPGRTHGGLTTYEWLVRERDERNRAALEKDVPPWARGASAGGVGGSVSHASEYPAGDVGVNPWTMDIPLEAPGEGSRATPDKPQPLST